MDDLEDLICDALQDSMDMDWTCRVGAKAVAEVVAAELTRLRQRETEWRPIGRSALTSGEPVKGGGE